MPSIAAFDELRRRMASIEKAMLQGLTEGQNLQQRQPNPYLQGTTEHCAWEEGWKVGVAYCDSYGVEPKPL
jgi:ribosome modulation factor